MTARMLDIDEFLPDVRTWVTGAPDPLVYRHLRAAAREFCEITRIWRETDTFTITDAGAEQICSIADSEIFEIEHARLDTVKLKPVTVDWLDANLPLWDQSTETSGAKYIANLYPDKVTIHPPQTGTLTARLILKPSRDALNLPEILLAKFPQVIGKGAAGMVLATPDTEFNNPKLAGQLMGEFQSRLDTEKMRTARSNVRGAVRTRARFF